MTDAWPPDGSAFDDPDAGVIDGRAVDDRTVDAEPDALDRLRRLAQAAELPRDHTVEADDAALEHLRELARAAEAAPGGPAPAAARPRRDLSTLDVPDVDELGGRRPPPPAEPAEPWRPPPRSVFPATRQPVTQPHAHPMWRWAALGLAAVVVVLLGWLLVGGDDAPQQDVPTGPTVTAPATGVVSTGVVGEGGAGG